MGDSAKERISCHAKAVHTEVLVSPLSKESPEQNYRGFLHLAILLLLVNNLRLIFENYMKYGFLLSIPGKFIPHMDFVLSGLIMAGLAVNLIAAFLVERSRRDGATTRRLVYTNCFITLAIPTGIIWNFVYHPVVGTFVLMVAVVMFMKLLSYHWVNADLAKGKYQDKLYEKCPYPKNLTLSNIVYFWFAPTLCYQPVYPRIPYFRPSFFAKRLIEYLSAMMMVYFLLEQYAVPTVRNSLGPMENMDVGAILERMLKLSVTSLYIWLLLFYAFFHSFLNALAEVLRFGDRSFYKCWWNAKSIDEYWRLWNLPVHNWFKRHVYSPLRSSSVSSSNAQFVIFFLSAVFHEFVVAVPTKIIQFWVFTGMIMQFPMILVTSFYLKMRPQSSFGNFFFWVSFCIVGQPMCILLYYRAWVDRQIN